MRSNLILDIGNSGTRVAVQVKEGENIRQSIHELSNQYAEVQEGYKLPEDYSTDSNTVFRIGNGEGEFYAHGNVVDKEFSSIALYPNGQAKKQDSLVTVITFNRALYEGYRILSKILDKPITDLTDVTWHVTCLLPPYDVANGSEKLYAKLNEIKKLEVIEPKLSFDIKIDGVTVYPEGFTAFVGALMSKGQKVRPESKKLLEAKVLVIDIGSGTSDFMVVDSTKIVDETKSTARVGGGNITSAIQLSLMKAFNINLPLKNILEGECTGQVKSGNKVFSLVDALKSARSKVASRLKQSIFSYFSGIMYPVDTIEYVLLCGGGSLESQVEGVPSLADYVLQELRTIAPNIELVPMPKKSSQSDKEDGETVNPRHLNIIGAAILSEK